MLRAVALYELAYPQCAAFAELFLHSLTRVVRPRIKKKRIMRFHKRACTFFSPFDVWGVLTARRQEYPGYPGERCAPLSCDISRRGRKRFRSVQVTGFNYKDQPATMPRLCQIINQIRELYPPMPRRVYLSTCANILTYIF